MWAFCKKARDIFSQIQVYLLVSLVLLPFSVLAGPYDNFQTRPGDVVRNIAIATFEVNGVSGGASFEADVDFTVQPFPSEGNLTAYQYAPGDPAAINMIFPPVSYSGSGSDAGPFLSLPAPTDNSTGPYSGQTHPVGGTLPVRPADRILPGTPIFFVLEDSSLNFDGNSVETVLVTITDAVTGDQEVLLFVETGPDTGIFTAYIETRREPVGSGDGFISTTPLSRIDAVYIDPFDVARNLEDEVLVGPVDPYGIVFDSLNGNLINGVRVTIINAATGQPAVVYGDDMVSIYPSSVVTGGYVEDSSGRGYTLAPGEYRFPFVDVGPYYFIIDDHPVYGFPSNRSDAYLQTLPGSPYTLVTGSRLEVFDVIPGPPIRIDIPADRLDVAQVIRTADRDRAEVGDFVEYTVEIIPSDNMVIDIVDTLPRGIDFVSGTLVINGVSYTPIVSEDGRTLTIPGYTAIAGEVIVITYVAQIGLGADGGLTYSSRTDVDGPRMRNAFDTHDLRVDAAFGVNSIAIIGHVEAGPCGTEPERADLSGIRIYMEDGRYVVTDAQGRFSFRDVSRRPHVVQIDELTLPRGARPVLCRNNTRAAASAISRFVDVAPGMMGHVDFRIVFEDQIEPLEKMEAALPSMSQVSDHDGEIPSGGAGIPGFEGEEFDPVSRYNEVWLAGLPKDYEQGLVYPRNGQLPPRSSIDVIALRKAGYSSRVFVNGEEVSSLNRRPAISGPNGLNIDRWAGVRINTGRNEVTLITTSPSGVEKTETHEVLYATEIANADLVLEGSRLETDGRTTPIVRVRFTDESGIPLRPGTRVTARIEDPFTFEPENPRRRSQDASEKAPSNTVSVVIGQDGTADFMLSPVLVTQTAEISFPRKAGEDPAIVRARISAAERPWILVGLAEGTLAESTIRRHMRRADDIGGIEDPFGGRIAFFAEGVIRGEWLLTLRYDSAMDGGGDFYGIDPKQDYIVYGDRSYQDNAAQSRFPLYLRLKKENAEILIGDFDATISTSLVNLNRRVTGLRVMYEGEKFRVMAFAAQTGQRFVEDRIPMNGTSGPFTLSTGGIVNGSASVSLITVSRLDDTEELEELGLEKGVDYVIDQIRGSIFLRRPIPSRSPEGNRYVLRVSYETDEEIEKGLLVGARATYEVSERMTLGGTVIRAENIDGRSVHATLVGVDVEYRLNERTTLSAEAIQVEKDYIASSGQPLTSLGRSAEIRIKYEENGNRLEAYVKSTRGSVGIDTSTRGDDVDIIAAEGAYRLSGPADNLKEGVFLEAAAIAERNLTTGSTRSQIDALVMRRTKHLSYGAGLSAVLIETDLGRSEGVRGIGALSWMSQDERFKIDATLEKVIHQEGAGEIPDVLSFSGSYKVSDRFSLFAGYDISENASRRDQALSFGAEFSPWDGGSFTVGLIGAQAGGQSGQAYFLGARQDFNIAEGTVLSFGADIQRDLGSNPLPVGSTIGNPRITEAFSTYRIGIQRNRESWAAGANLEYSKTAETTGILFRMRADGEVTPEWSLGGELALGQKKDIDGTTPEVSLRFAAAHRQGPRDPFTLIQIEGDTIGKDNLRLYGSIYHSRELSEVSRLNLRAAAKYNLQSFSSGSVSDTLGFLGAEYRHDFGEKFDFGLHGAVMGSARTGQTRSSYGVSLGFTPFENGWISVGYNFAGFRDPDFSSNGFTDKGAFIQFRLKFDQNSIKRMFR